MKFVINRSTWRCGEQLEGNHGEGYTSLLNKEGYSCCLGQICIQQGVPNEALMHTSYPRSVKLDPYLELISFLRNGAENSELAADAATINDGPATREVKEKNLIQLFKDHNHEIVFEGEYTEHCTNPPDYEFSC